ncbi:MAG: hypothetical protein HQL68_11445, partial [Magnetococcales bacterium]|nr:hypothetical protein [Magnetococcales bacterium]
DAKIDDCYDIKGVSTKNTGWFCELSNNKDRHVDFILYGDSHAASAIPAFRQYGELLGLRGIATTRSECPPLIGLNSSLPNRANDCSLISEKILNYAQANNVATVFLVGMWSNYTEQPRISDSKTGIQPSNYSERVSMLRKGLERSIKKFENIGTKIVLVGPTPLQNYWPRQVYKHIYLLPKPLMQTKLDKLHSNLKDHNRIHKHLFKIFKSKVSNSFLYFDTTPYYCDKTKCLIGTLDRSFYADTNHLSAAGTQGIYNMLVDNSDLILEKIN